MNPEVPYIDHAYITYLFGGSFVGSSKTSSLPRPFFSSLKSGIAFDYQLGRGGGRGGGGGGG